MNNNNNFVIDNNIKIGEKIIFRKILKKFQIILKEIIKNYT